MARRAATVRELASQAGADLDETIVSLWDAGIDYVSDPGDLVRSVDLARAKRALGVATPRELRSSGYWSELLGLNDTEFSNVLAELNIVLQPGARQLPKGAVAKLKGHSRGRSVRSTKPAAVQAKPENFAPLVWIQRGRERDVRHLTADEVQQIHDTLVLDFALSEDPIDPPGVRDANLLESAVFRQHTSLGDQAKYSTPEMCAAALMHSIVHDHPFHNGNKRTALVAMLVLLDENGLLVTCDEDEIFKFTLQVAQHRVVPRGADDRADREVLSIAEWVCSNARRVEKGERPIAWRRLKRILAAFTCEWEMAHVGNRMNVSRTVKERRLFGVQRPRRLTTQLHYRDDGTEVERNSLNKIRRDLWLDEEHGIDSRSFYEGDDELAATDFIATYRKTLDRLARL